LAALDSRGVGLWDVVLRADLIGSLDMDLVPLQEAPVPRLLARWPGIRMVLFNGAAAWKLSRGWREQLGIPAVRLPSTSPTWARPFPALVDAWRAAFDPHDIGGADCA
jgi:G:T/U-mismatch repair DNA glycosylase